MAFKYRTNLLGENGRMLRKFVLDASTDFQVGDVVAGGTGGEGFDGEVLTADTSHYHIVGVIQAIITKDGVSPSSDGCGGAFVDKYRTATNNETGAQVSVI